MTRRIIKHSQKSASKKQTLNSILPRGASTTQSPQKAHTDSPRTPQQQKKSSRTVKKKIPFTPTRSIASDERDHSTKAQSFKSMRNIKDDEDDYTDYLWSVRLREGRPILVVYETGSNRIYKGKPGNVLGYIKSVRVREPKQGSVKNNIEFATAVSRHLLFDCISIAAQDREETTKVVCIGDAKVDQMDESVFEDYIWGDHDTKLVQKLIQKAVKNHQFAESDDERISTPVTTRTSSPKDVLQWSPEPDVAVSMFASDSSDEGGFESDQEQDEFATESSPRDPSPPVSPEIDFDDTHEEASTREADIEALLRAGYHDEADLLLRMKPIYISSDDESDVESNKMNKKKKKEKAPRKVLADKPYNPALLAQNKELRQYKAKVERELKPLSDKTKNLYDSKHLGRHLTLRPSLIMNPAMNEAHRPIDVAHLKKMIRSRTIFQQMDTQPAVIDLVLKKDTTAFKLAKKVLELKSKATTIERNKYLTAWDKLQDEMERAGLKYFVEGSTHTTTTDIIVATIDQKLNDIVIYGSVFLNLDPSEKELIASLHNMASSTVMKDDLLTLLKSGRKHVLKLSPNERKEYVIPASTLELVLKTTTSGAKSDHIKKGLCLNDECFKLLLEAVARHQEKSSSFLEHFNVSLPIEYKKDVLQRLVDKRLNIKEFKKELQRRAKNDRIISFVLEKDFIKDEGIMLEQEFKERFPLIYKDIVQGEYDDDFKKFDFRKAKSGEYRSQLPLPRNLSDRIWKEIYRKNKQVARRVEADTIDLSEDERRLSRHTINDIVVRLKSLGDVENYSVVQVHDTYHIVINGPVSTVQKLLFHRAKAKVHLLILDYPQGTSSHPWDTFVSASDVSEDIKLINYSFDILDSSLVIYHSTKVLNDVQKTLRSDPLNFSTYDCFWVKPVPTEPVILENMLFHQNISPISISLSQRATSNILKRETKPSSCVMVFEDPSKEELILDNGKIVNEYQKPLELEKYLIGILSDEDDIVFSGYSGTGTTAVAAASLGRHSISIEQDSDYYHVIVDRLRSLKEQHLVQTVPIPMNYIPGSDIVGSGDKKRKQRMLSEDDVSGKHPHYEEESQAKDQTQEYGEKNNETSAIASQNEKDMDRDQSTE